MKKNIYVSLITLAISLTAFAKPSTPPKQQRTQAKSPWSVGIGGIYTFNAYKDTKDTKLIIPMLTYIGKRLTVAGPYVGYKLLQKKSMTLAAQVFLYPLNFKPSKSSDPDIQKLDKRKYTIMGGVRSDITLNRNNKIQVGASKSIYGANGYFLNGQYNYTHTRFINGNVLIIRPSAGIEWHSKALNNYYYGISEAEYIRTGLDQYNASSSFNPFVAISFLYNFKRVWTLGLTSRITFLPSTIQNSPMVDKNRINTAILFLTRTF